MWDRVGEDRIELIERKRLEFLIYGHTNFNNHESIVYRHRHPTHFAYPLVFAMLRTPHAYIVAVHQD